MTKPIVAIPADIRSLDGATWHAVQHQYLRAALNAAGVMAFIIPAFEEGYETDAILNRVDGVLFFDGSNDALALPSPHPNPAGEPCMFLAAIRYDASKSPGTWHWPGNI